MAALGTAFNWVRVTGGVWTRISQGPLVQGFFFQALELSSISSGSFPTASWTLDGYSAAPPFYQRTAGTSRLFPGGAPPVGHSGLYSAVLSFRSSPWVEFWLLSSVPCYAHIAYA